MIGDRADCPVARQNTKLRVRLRQAVQPARENLAHRHCLESLGGLQCVCFGLDCRDESIQYRRDCTLLTRSWHGHFEPLEVLLTQALRGVRRIGHVSEHPSSSERMSKEEA